MTAAMGAWTTGSARTHAGAEGTWHHRAAGPTGTHARGEWSRKDDHSFGTSGTAGTIHAVVMTERVIIPGDEGAGEEDDRQDENSAGNDHYPGRSLVQTRRFRHARRGRRRRAGGRRRLELRLGCLSHPLIMPTGAPAIKHRAQESRMSYQTDALAPPTQNRTGCLLSYQHKNQAKRRITTAMSRTPATIATQAATWYSRSEFSCGGTTGGARGCGGTGDCEVSLMLLHNASGQ